MFSDLIEVEKYIQENNVKTIDLKYCDLFGGWHHVSLPAKPGMAKNPAYRDGIGFDSSSVPGFKAVEVGDMCIIPDLNTGFVDPFWEEPALSFICNIVEADSKAPFYRDPRIIAKKAEEYLVSTGIADRSQWGPEFEYFIFSPGQSRIAGIPDSPGSPGSIPVSQESKYHAIPPLDKYHDLRAETAELLLNAGVEVHYHHHEAGCPSQQEIEVVLGPLQRMGDVAQMVKYFVKMTAQRHNVAATFMPKPLYNEAGSGMHFHQHLFKANQPLFYDKKGFGGLSKLALSYIAGVLTHAPALSALTNPSTNSFKRLVPGYEAPVNIFFSLANRSAAVRVPKYANAPDEKRIEFRPPDATCNPYIAMAAMLLAGIDGIKQKMDPEEMGLGPFDQNLFAPENGELRRTIKSLPSSLKEALEALHDDHEFLTEGEVFSEDTIEAWIEYKLNRDVSEFSGRPHPYEHALYFNC